ncbi:unnamed protein product [Cunninghamella blakesleeana]
MLYRIYYTIILPFVLLSNTINGYLIGSGRGDITASVVEHCLFGYADFNQIGQGVLQRVYARAYIIVDEEDNDKRVVYVNLDTQSSSDIVKDLVVNKLKTIYGPNLYTLQNVMIASTHTHSNVGGYLDYTLYEIPVKGFIKETVKVLVTGIVRAIQRAHNNLEKGTLTLNSGELLNTNINCSPAAYLLNKDANQYAYDVDKTMSVLGFHSIEKDYDLGLISWFPVHGVSVNKTNKLVNGDNKGYASYFIEDLVKKNKSSTFVAAFPNANEGDVSPNTLGSFCTGTNKPCDGTRNTKCPLFSTCQGRGPGWEIGHLESNRIIGENQGGKAIELYEQAKKNDKYNINGPVDHRQVFWNVSHSKILQSDGSYHSLCPPAMGLSFAAGTTDEEPGLGIYQNTTNLPLYARLFRLLIKSPSKRQVACHAPKPILFDTGELNFPHSWQPHVLDLQLFRIGNVYIAAVPAEFTTMSGRRLKKAIKEALVENGADPNDIYVILSGLSNGYSSYVATYEEYQMQRFEGASTAYGPHTLEGYIYVFKKLAKSIITQKQIELSSDVPFEPSIVNQVKSSFDFTPQIGIDHAGLFRNFGDVVDDVSSTYHPTSRLKATVSATFVAGNPRRNTMLENTYLTVEKKLKDGTWETIKTDHDYDTRFRWHSISKLFGQSEATIEWEINNETEAGIYRLGYFGHHKSSYSGPLKTHYGYSSEFTIQ